MFSSYVPRRPGCRSGEHPRGCLVAKRPSSWPRFGQRQIAGDMVASKLFGADGGVLIVVAIVSILYPSTRVLRAKTEMARHVAIRQEEAVAAHQQPACDSLGDLSSLLDLGDPRERARCCISEMAKRHVRADFANDHVWHVWGHFGVFVQPRDGGTHFSTAIKGRSGVVDCGPTDPHYRHESQSQQRVGTGSTPRDQGRAGVGEGQRRT